MAMGNLGKPNINKGLKTGFKAMTLTKAAPQRANVVGDVASNSQLVRKGRSGGSANPVKRKKKAMY